MEDIKVNDIASDLFILNKHTVDILFSLDNCADCFSLYGFYYKLAKYQKTNSIKATDDYVRKQLNWGKEKLVKIKNTLKDNGLIKTINRKDEDGKIVGWYIEVSYLVSSKKIESIETNHKSPNPLVEKATGGNQDLWDNNINNNNIICLKNKINMLENKILELEKQNKENVSNDTKEKNKKYLTFGEYGRVKLTQEQYDKLCSEFGKTFIDNEIALLDEYVEINNNKGNYKNYNLVLRKAIRENWFKHNNYQVRNQQPEPQRYKGFDIDKDKFVDTHPEFDLDDLPY